jgi:hypothetical protein
LPEIQWPVFLIANWQRTILLVNERFLNIRMVLGTGHSNEQFKMNQGKGFVKAGVQAEFWCPW